MAVLAAAQALQAQTADDVRRAYGAQPPDRVEALLQAGLRAAPNDAELLLFAGELRADRGQFEEAEVYLRRALAVRASPSTLTRTRVELGRVRFAQGDVAAARAQLDSARAGPAEYAQLAAWYGHELGLDRTYAGWSTSESEHLRLHLQPGTTVDPQEYLRDHEAALAEVQAFFGAKLPKKIDLFLWSSSAEAQRTGLEPLGFARPLVCVAHLRPGEVRGHELAHVAAYWAVLPWRSTRFVSDGTAAAFDLNNVDRIAAARAAVQQAGLGAVSIEQLWGDVSTTPAPVIYAVGALVMQRLIDRGGKERFLAFLPDQSLENARRVYGPTLTEIIAETERDLAAAPADSAS